MGQRKTASAGTPGQPPFDIEAVQRSILHKLARGLDLWRGCPRPACRRARGCAARRRPCVGAKALPQRRVSDEQVAARNASLQRAIKRRLAEIRGKVGAG